MQQLWNWISGRAMNVLQMTTQVSTLSKGFHTKRALKWSSASVLSEMISQIAGLLKYAITTWILAFKVKLHSRCLRIPYSDSLMPVFRHSLKSLVFLLLACAWVMSSTYLVQLRKKKLLVLFFIINHMSIIFLLNSGKSLFCDCSWILLIWGRLVQVFLMSWSSEAVALVFVLIRRCTFLDTLHLMIFILRGYS